MEIVPHTSLGPVLLGAGRAELPAGAVIEGNRGRLEQIDFRLKHDAVVEIWIADLRTFPHDLVVKGQTVDPRASSAKLRNLFGICTRHKVEARAERYSCQEGLALSFMPDDSAEAVELRLR
jgi:hypothetical protein